MMLSLNKNSVISNLGYVVIALVCGIFIFQATHFVPHDFANYYFGGEFLKLKKLNSSIYFPHVFNQEVAALGAKNLFLSYAPNTPFLAVFFYPFTFLSLTTAKLVFNFLSFGLFIYSLKNLAREYQIKPVFLALIPFVFFIPLRNNFLFGQVYLLLFFLLSEGFLAYKKKAYLKMGIFWGIAVLLKVFPIILLGMLFFQKKHKAIMYLVFVCLILFGISILITGWDSWYFFFSSVLPKTGNGEISGEFVQNYQSVFMFLKYLFRENTIAFSISLKLFKLIILLLGYFITKYENSQLKVFSFWIFASILLSPYGSTYTNLVLIFPLLFVLKNEEIKREDTIFILLLLGVTFLPVSYFSTFDIPFSFPRLWLMIALFIIFFYSNFKQLNPVKSTVFIASVLTAYFFFMFPKEKEIHRQNLSKDHILTYNYTFEGNKLVYIYWDNYGEQKQKTAITVNSIDTINTSLINNQVFYKNKQLTFDTSNKLKPAFINNSQLIYLSDANKGIGFYSLILKKANNKPQ